MKLLWLSNAPLAPSGYGGQTALFCPRLRELGHEVSIAANYGVQAATLEWNGMPVFPANDNWGNPTISTFAKHVEADWVIALCDAWVMRPDNWADDLRMAIWAPIDHYPIPPDVLAVLQHPKVQPIAMSRFGEEWMRKFQLDPLYVPHGVDTEVFKSRPHLKAGARAMIRREDGTEAIPEDAFLVGMVAANSAKWQFPRKGFPQAFDAFARFARRHKDAYLYAHTRKVSALDLRVLALATGCPGDRVAFPSDVGWHLGIFSREYLAEMYCAFDVLLNPSMGEGFGIPIVEAQACGVPVIASDHSAMNELTQAGWLVEGDRWWDEPQQSFGINPSIKGIEEALENAYEARDDAELRSRAVQFAQAYDADRVTELYWKPALEQLGRPREVPPLSVNGNRAQRRAAQRKAKARA
jgi:glycosyltransferase involved in cell wall biosynthesis